MAISAGQQLAAWAAIVWTLAGCAAGTPASAGDSVPLVGYTIQAGAFAVVENAVRLNIYLQTQGTDSTFFKDTDGLYKVRFGSFAGYSAARRRAESLVAGRVIADFYIVAPNRQTAARRRKRGDAYVREQIVATARRYIGLPYLWGGSSPKTGFDCSGLTLTAYRLNGYLLPRTSGAQFRAGKPVDRTRLAKGDLVFFAITDKKTVSHVGLYTGDGRFVHAPGKGKIIRIDRLSDRYYGRRFVGARSYL